MLTTRGRIATGFFSFGFGVDLGHTMAKRKAKQQAVSEAKKRKPGDVQDLPKPPLDSANTLYVQNLNDQVSVGDLRTTLYMVFSIYGHLIAVNAHKSPKMRGQAHIVFARPEFAARALEKLQGHLVLGKPLKLAYAKSKSHSLEKLERKPNFASHA